MSSPEKTEENEKIGLKCFVCRELRQAFICVKCVCSGDFTRSNMFHGHRCTADTTVTYDAKGATIVKWTMKDREAFSELMEIEQTRINERFEELLTKYKELGEIENIIAKYEFKISNIKNLIKLRKLETKLAEERSVSMVKNEVRLQTRIESLVGSNKDINDAIDHGNNRLETNYAEKDKIAQEIKRKNRENLLKLKEIFPITGWGSKYPGLKSHKYDSKSDYRKHHTPLAHWTFGHNLCCIVESWIAGDSGSYEYSEFISLCKQREKLNRDLNLHLHNHTRIRDNSAYRVSSALANISQLISVASSLLDLRLPQKQKFMDWFIPAKMENPTIITDDYPTDAEILHKAAKLNANLTYLCVSQNVPPELLYPHMTGNNLWLFLDPDNEDLGRSGPFTVPFSVIEGVDHFLLSDFLLVDAKDYEDIEFVDEELSDWEAIPSSTVFEVSHEKQSTINSESMLTNLAETCYNTIASFIKR